VERFAGLYTRRLSEKPAVFNATQTLGTLPIAALCVSLQGMACIADQLFSLHQSNTRD